MINNWDYKEMQMDFSSMYDDNNHPSDIDLFYLGKDEQGDDVLILGEIKQTNGLFRDGQRRLLEQFARKWQGTSLILYIRHNKDYKKGDRVVDVANCRVEEYYYSKAGRWVQPKTYLTVRDVIDTYRK